MTRTAHLYRDALERWHRARLLWPALDHDQWFPSSEDYHVPDAEAERIRLEVARLFELSHEPR